MRFLDADQHLVPAAAGVIGQPATKEPDRPGGIAGDDRTGQSAPIILRPIDCQPPVGVPPPT